MILLLAGGALSLLGIALRLLLSTLRLLILLIISTLSSRMRWKTLGRVVAGASVATRVALRLELLIHFAKFLAIALQAYSLVELCLKLGEYMTLELVVKWPYQAIQEAIMSLCMSINIIGRITRQLSKLVPILTD